MFQNECNLKGKRILITNDDGYYAEGIHHLYEMAKKLSDDVWIVAPSQEQSGASHSLTLHKPLRYKRFEDKKFSVEGTPTDCVLFALNYLMKKSPPDLVLSGINYGSNLGEDVTYSGTIAAAMEATLLGVRAIALSLHLDFSDHYAHWSTVEEWAPEIICKLMAQDWDSDVLMNVNFPAVESREVKGVKVVPHGKRKYGENLTERLDPRGRPYFWIGALRGEADAKSDVDVGQLYNGSITITPLSMDLTRHQMLAQLQTLF